MKRIQGAARALSLAAAVLVGLSAVQTPDPAQVGQWSDLIPWPHVGVHAHLLRTGEVLTWQYGSTAVVWDPQTGVFTNTGNPFTDLLCAGHTFLADGRLLTLGGWERSGGGLGVADTSLFDPFAHTWTRGPSMAYRRWYPTATTLPDGRVLVISGDISRQHDIAAIPEIYDPLTNAFSTVPQATNALPVYPFDFVLPDGRLLAAGSSEIATPTQALDSDLQRWTTIDPVSTDGASAVMFAPGKILKAGTAADSGNTGTAANTAYLLDMTAPSPAWRPTGSMAFPRAFMNLTALPDGSVVATGGGTDRSSFDTANAVLQAEIWSPATETWTTMSAMSAPRLYHSTALLLPDGRVLVTGGGSDTGVADQLTGQVFSPPYLFKGPRPSISSAPADASYGASFFVATPDAAGIGSVALIAAGSVTHAFNVTQRFVPLTFQVTDGGLNLTAPSSATLAPPGAYLLFLVSTSGIPSAAAIVNVHPGTAPPAPVNLRATAAASSVSLAWEMPAGSPPITRYTVYRSTTSGFTPGPSNAVGQSVTTSYADGALTDGTYYYRVAAQDSSGAQGPPSSEASATVTQQSGTVFGVDQTVFADGAGPRTTAPFNTTGSGELLLAFVASDGSGTQTITVSGAGLTWSLVKRVNTQAGTSEIWKASAPNPLTNATVTATQASRGFAESLTVVAFTGATAGASAGANASSGPPTVSLTTTQPGSVVYGVGNDWDRAVARVPAAGQTLVHQVLASSGDTFWVQATAAMPAAGTLVQVSDTAPTTDRWNLAAIEVVPAGPPPQVVVPDVTNRTQSDAAATLTAAGLRIGTVTQQPSTTIAAGLVISQNPAANAQVPAGSAVDLVVSSGPPPVAVPNVLGLTQSAAGDALGQAGLTLGAVSTAPSATVAAGLVITENPAAGTLVSPGTSVAIVLSSGPSVGPTPDKTVSSDGTGTRTTAAFSTASPNEVLVAFVASDGPSAKAQTVTVSGAGVPWSLVMRANTQKGTSEIWTATATAALTNVTVKSVQSATGYAQSLTVMTFSASSGIGAIAAASAASGPPSVSLTATHSGSLVFAVGNDWDRAVSRVPSAGQSLVHQSLVSTGDTFWVQTYGSAVAAGSLVIVSDTAPTNDQWNFACVEIMP